MIHNGLGAIKQPARSNQTRVRNELEGSDLREFGRQNRRAADHQIDQTGYLRFQSSGRPILQLV